MNVAVLTLTRDRLRYTQHCFQTLRDNAGTEFDWYVLDQASQDGTVDWLHEQDDITTVALDDNIGICRGLNLLLDTVCDAHDYDAIVRFDNDCEVTSADALVTAAEAAAALDWIVAPTVRGLDNPPAALPDKMVGPYLIGETEILGGIFMAMPAHLFTGHGYRYNERFPLFTGDEDICRWWRERGGHCGYLRDWHVNHYLTTRGQWDDVPAYFERKRREAIV